MKKVVSILLIMMLMLGGLLPACAIDAKVRIMDLTHIKGVRENQLVGYGVVVGLPGTGDNSRSTQITNKMLLRNLGTVIEQENYIQKGASAAVIVTATVPPFSKNGDKIDVTVSAMADCKSLEGGVLVQTILKAPNGEAVAVAQGPLSVGGINKIAGGSSARTAITTTGRIPARFINDRVNFLSIIENLEVSPTMDKAKVVVNERTGTVVIGADVKLLPAAVAHGNITVTVSTTNDVSQPNGFSNGATVGFENSDIQINKAPGSLVTMPANSNLNDLVRALNSIGVAPVDLISILQALKKSGSLQADLVII